jgi:NO-binding membrane sensor protein with MHYT domain
VGTVHEFSNGPLNPALAYAVACLGAFLGFRCITRARAQTGFARANWLILAAVSIGAAGNWAMHFIAMLGVTMSGAQILYNVPLTIVSMLIVIVVVGIGLFVGYGSGNGGRARLVTGGVIAGLGVVCMHYLGEAAMVMPDSVHYNTVLVVLSVLIAVGAGIAGLWAGIQVRGIGTTIVASLIMGIAITGIHYIAMAAMEMSPGLMPSTSGSAGGSFLFPLVLGISLVTFILALTLSLSPTEDEIEADALLKRRILAGSGDGLWSAVPSQAAPQPVPSPQATVLADDAASARSRPSLPQRRGPSRGRPPWA